MVFSRKTLVFNYLNSSISTVFVSSSSYIYDATRGYYNDLGDWEAPILMKSYMTKLIKQIRATFYGYADTPSACLGRNTIEIVYTDVTIGNIGTSDYSGGANQGIYKGDAGDEISVARDVVGETYTITLNGAKTTNYIQHRGSYFPAYPKSNRGTKDIKFAYGDSPNWSKELTSAERHFITKWNNKKRVA